MPRYNTLDNKANVSELDPYLAAKIRLKKNRCCNWKFFCAGIASILLLLVVGGALFYTFVWNGTENLNILYTAESPSNQSDVQVTPVLPTTQDSPHHVQISKPSEPINRRLSPDRLETINTFGRTFETCDEYLINGFNQTGVYRLCQPGVYDFSAQCVMNEGDQKAWMVMQRRTSGELAFWNRTFGEYVQGFGNSNGDHWLGLKQVRGLIESGCKLQLKVEIEGERCRKDLNDLYYVGIWKFKIDSSSDYYRLRVSDILSGNFTDPLYNMASSNTLQFNLIGPEIENPVNCLEKLHLGGWWSFNNGCTFISLNGEYTCKKEGTLYGLAVYLRGTENAAGTFRPTYIRPQSTRMMLHVCNGEENCK